MNTKTIIAVAVAAIAVLAVTSIILVSGGGEENNTSGGNTTDAVVWLDTNDGSEPISSDGSGANIRAIIESAFSDKDIVFRANGNVASVDGIENTDSHVWTIFRWASPNGWGAFIDTDTTYVDGMNVALRYSERTTGEKGEISYSAPDIEVKYRVDFFIQIREEINSTYWLKALPLTDSEKMHGLWISGEGSTTSEALADAVLTNFFPNSTFEIEETIFSGEGSVKYVVDGIEEFYSYRLSPVQNGWINYFLGWYDTARDDDSKIWTYWVQYNYSPQAKSLDNPDYWEFNSNSFGKYDITSHHYFALVLMTTTESDEGYSTNLPTPSEILRVS